MKLRKFQIGARSAHVLMKLAQTFLLIFPVGFVNVAKDFAFLFAPPSYRP